MARGNTRAAFPPVNDQCRLHQPFLGPPGIPGCSSEGDQGHHSC